jgi:hypothetical protein
MGYPPALHITIRLATPAERAPGGLGKFWATGKPMRARRYIVVDADEPAVWVGAFGLADTTNTRAEAVFWAERWASKNDGHFIRPAGFEHVQGALPVR